MIPAALLVLKPVTDFLKAIPWQVWLAIGLIAAFLLHGYMAHREGYAEAEDHYKRIIKAQNEANQKAIDEAKAAARDAERRHEKALDAVQNKLILERAIGYEERDRVINDLRAGNRRLQQRFTCPPAGRSGGVPAATTGTGADNGTGGAGFTAADAEIAFRIAADGDDAIRKLQACQAVIRADREPGR